MKVLRCMERLISTKSAAKYLPSVIVCRKYSSEKSHPSFKFDNLQVDLSPEYGLKEAPNLKNLLFGQTFSDHMFQVEWTELDGWGTPRIVPLYYFHMHPGSKVLHYAQAAFEGMKAFRYSDQTVALFRPDLNMQRLKATAGRACLPEFDEVELLKCLKKLVSIDRRWVPDQSMSSLYIRPTFIGIENTLGVSSSNKALLYIVTCPVGPYFKSGIQPVSLLADPKYVRACPGGVGSYKMAANYAPSLFVQKLAQAQGYDQVLWLLGKNYQITEAGAMNVFLLLQKADKKLELVTPILDGTILPGVIRRSVLELAKSWGEFEVSERIIHMSELITASKEKRLLEVFLCGTACSICPVKKIRFKDCDIPIPTASENALYMRLYRSLTDIQYGRTKSNWSIPVYEES